LPTFKKLRREASALGNLGWLLGNGDARKTVRGINDELDGLVLLVDDFYRLLGDRNWVFSEALNLDRMRKVVAQPTPEGAERELVEYLKEEDAIHRMITRLNRFPDMRPRIPLLEKAERDYLEGRYYSSVLVTVSMMDGFVNDAFKAERKGLHAREAGELHSEDCVATVWDGLPSVQKTFTKSVSAREDKPVYEVYRNGIMHGMITDYDNDVVASKAWCMLFAVGDWVDSVTRPQIEGDGDRQSLAETLGHLSETHERDAENDTRLKAWKKHQVNLEHPSSPDDEVLRSCNDFLEAWRAKNCGSLGSFFPNIVDMTSGKLAGQAGELYSPHPIEEYDIEEMDRPAAAVALARARLRFQSRSWTALIRLCRFDGADPAAEWEPGAWKVSGYGVDPFADIEEAEPKK
ncbi:MAG: hypothetical protein ACI364_00735, partial [Coriobacteriales bacterium]